MVNIWLRSTCSVDVLFRKPGCPRPEGPDLRRGPPQGRGAGLAAGLGPALAPMTERYASFFFPSVKLVHILQTLLGRPYFS